MADRSTSCPSPCSASAMSYVVTEPKSRPSTPALRVTWTITPSIFVPRSDAAASASACARSSSTRRPSNSARFSGVARFALPCGIRKFRAKPSFTLTTSPRPPRLTIFSSRMTCIAAPSVQIGVRQQREEARAFDRVGKLALVVRLGAGDPRGNDPAVLVDEVLQQIDILVVDPHDLLGGEAAKLAPLEQLARASFRPSFRPPLPLPLLGGGMRYSFCKFDFGHVQDRAAARPAFGREESGDLHPDPEGRRRDHLRLVFDRNAVELHLDVALGSRLELPGRMPDREVHHRDAGGRVAKRVTGGELTGERQAVAAVQCPRASGRRFRGLGGLLRGLLRMQDGLGFLVLHHRRRRGHRAFHLDDEMPQHRVVELERVVELVHRFLVALDVHQDVVRLVNLLDRIRELAATPVLEAMDLALPRGDRAAVAFDHRRNLLALVRMDDEDDLVVPHADSLWMKPPNMRDW